MSFRLPRLIAATAALLTLAATLTLAFGGQTAAADDAERVEISRRIKAMQRERLVQRQVLRMQKGKERAKQLEALRKRDPKASLPHAVSGKKSNRADEVPATSRAAFAAEAARRAGRYEAEAVSSLGINLLVNDTTDNRFTAAGQAEPSIVAWGSYVIVAWNDGQGFEDGPNADLQGYGYSTDYGQTFVDGGNLPRPAGSRWTSDPVLTVNEKTGEFYYVGLIEPTSNSNGIGIVRAVFDGTTLDWDVPRIIVQGSNATDFYDKPWVVADSASGRLYVTYTHFFGVTNAIEFRRSLDSWTQWGPALALNTVSAGGLVQGSRPAVGPNGEVYAIWKEIGEVDKDFFPIRKSTNQGGTWAPQEIAAEVYDNFGTGAPGFNRERGITFPSIAVDRSFGANRGRVYVAWNECINWYKDLDIIGDLGLVTETEPNEHFAGPKGPTPFVPGQTLRGNFSTISDIDLWSFAATQGVTYTFWCDSIPVSLYSMRIICSDTLTRLNLTGDLDAPATNTNGFIVWTAPSTGTYTLRMFANIPGSAPGFYQILTTANTVGPEPARDHRDIMVVTGMNGTGWSSPVRVNQDPPLYDGWLPEVSVGQDGRVFVAWYGWHESFAGSCGGESHIYLASSSNAGATWNDVGRVTDTITPWTFTNSNIQPNQGDYMGLYANDLGVHVAWSDGRFGNPDVYALAVPTAVTPALVSLAGAEASPDGIRVSWYAASSRVTEAYVYRLEGGAWILKSAITRDGTGKLVYEDSDVVPGVRYVYRLGVRDGEVERFFGEVSVTVPSRFALRIDSVRPNPTPRDVWVSFTLPADAAATLSLWDVSGRRLAQRTVGGLGRGRHLLNLGEGLQLATGIYVVRLEQAGELRSARISVVR
jgi:hypothetical protein